MARQLRRAIDSVISEQGAGKTGQAVRFRRVVSVSCVTVVRLSALMSIFSLKNSISF